MSARILLAVLAALPCLTSGANLGSDGSNIPVAVILNFGNRSWSPAALRIMQAEAASLLRTSGVDLLWSIHGQPQQQIDFGQLVLFRMSGKCAMDSFPIVPDELGLPLARTHSSDGEILPFGEVDCDRVRTSVKRSILPGEFGRGNEIFGRALGRVLAHEMYHMLAKSSSHAGGGVTRACLSSKDLTVAQLVMPEESLQAIRHQLGLIKTAKSSVRKTTGEAPVSGEVAAETVP